MPSSAIIRAARLATERRACVLGRGDDLWRAMLRVRLESLAIIPWKCPMHIHILGICGTFMGGTALLARAAGHRVTGCDANVYPPMSVQLMEQGIALTEGYDAGQIALRPDLFVVGNAISR